MIILTYESTAVAVDSSFDILTRYIQSRPSSIFPCHIILSLHYIDGSTHIDEKTRKALHFAEKVTRNAYKVTEEDMQTLRATGCSDEDIFEAVAVTSLFNYIDRMADILSAPVEGFQEMVAQMQKE